MSLCAGKRSFLSKVVFTDAHNAGSSLPTHAPPSPKLSVQYQFTSRSMQSRQKAAPRRASIQIILSLSCQSKQWEEAGTFSSWEENRPMPPPPKKKDKTKNTRWMWKLNSRPYVCGCTPVFPLGTYLESHFQLHGFHLT